ncbi:MAG: NADP-dependent oxidoreductase [Pseudomonadales bacterium]|nr:MAG: NADP-dependent oxidoreductase [Pseudomonadales bacterium]
MIAVTLHAFGGPDVLRIEKVPAPTIAPGQVIVDIHAASVNAADWKVRSGNSAIEVKFPHILGRDFSGVVSAVSEGVDLEVGDPVFGVCPPGTEGAYAEKISIASELIALKPDALTHAEAAAICLAGLTALVAIEDTLKVTRDEKVLIQGGAGGVGSMAVQIANQLGAKVVATASARNHSYLRDLGATQLIDYNRESVSENLGDCDAVLDTIGGHTVADSFAALKSGGRAAFISGGPTAPEPTREGVTSLRPSVGRSRALMQRLADYAESRAIRPPELTTLPMEDVQRAHELSQAGHVRGKIVLIP